MVYLYRRSLGHERPIQILIASHKRCRCRQHASRDFEISTASLTLIVTTLVSLVARLPTSRPRKTHDGENPFEPGALRALPTFKSNQIQDVIDSFNIFNSQFPSGAPVLLRADGVGCSVVAC